MNNKHYKSINEISELLKIHKHVIRYWDQRFDGVSTRLGKNKRRFFSPLNIKKLEALKKLLHTNGKSHHSIEMAKKILNNYSNNKNNNFIEDKTKNDINIANLVKVSQNLKKLL